MCHSVTAPHAKVKKSQGLQNGCFRPASLLRMLHGQDVWTWRGIAERAGWTLRYARLNVLALRKILKKHDKVMRSHFGKELLQVACHLHQLVPVPVIHRTIMHMSCTPNGRASCLTYPSYRQVPLTCNMHGWQKVQVPVMCYKTVLRITAQKLGMLCRAAITGTQACTS